MRLRVLLALWPSLLLTACAGSGASGVEHALGWRSATVMAIGRAAEFAPEVDRDCDAGGASAARYAVVRYSNGGLHSRSLGSSQVPADLAVGDDVYVNVLDCKAGIRR